MLCSKFLTKLIAAILVIAAFVSSCLADYQAWNISYSDTSYLLSDIITEDMTDKEKITAICIWCEDYFDYDYGTYMTWQYTDKSKLPDIYIVDIEKVIKTGKGICLDQAAVCVSLIKDVGLNARIAICESGHHAVAAFKYGKDWYAVDITRNEKPVKITDKITSKTLPEMAADEYKLY